MLVTWRYRQRNSLIQSFDPRAWLIFFALFISTTLIFWDFRYLCGLLVIALLVIFTSGIHWSEMYRAWLFIGGFIIFFSLLTFLTGRGGMELYAKEHMLAVLKAPFNILGWTPTLAVSAEKTMFAASMLVRVFCLASMTILIPYSLNPAHYGVTFRGLGVPDKIAYGMDLTMRFIPTFGRDFTLTMDAQRARGYEIEKISGGLISQVRKLAPLVVPVTIHAIAGSEDIIDAMDLRAFGVGPRTWLVKLIARRRDYALVIFGLILFIISLTISLFGYGKFWVPEFLLALAH
ncbi:MAG: energy-coupling factor transporter transmembrane protein EcfT [Anaerolineae bacterium]|nr:energy-coupling factor transporter transmembrane protein EcfT [Anaerolineae bacterium]